MWRKAVTLEELSLMSDEQVMIKINEFLVPPERAGSPARSEDLIGAQFYMAELDRRAAQKLEKERQAAEAERDRIEAERWKIDLRNEKSIMRLIWLEILVTIAFGLWGFWEQSQSNIEQLEAFGKMRGALSHLEASSSSTAQILQNLQSTTQDMNDHIAKQLGLNYEPAIDAVYNGTNGMIHVTNNGPTPITIYGFTVGDYDLKRKDPVTVLSHNSVDLNSGPFYSQQKDSTNNPLASFPLTVYFRTENNDEYVLIAELVMSHSNTNLFDARFLGVKVKHQVWGYKLKGPKWN